MTTAAQSTRIKVHYDGLCPLCKREIRIITKRDRAGVIEPVDIAASDFDAEKLGLTRAAVHARMHAILPDGRVVTGMAAFRRIYDALGLGWLWRWTGWPIIRPICDMMYACFARFRPRLQRFASRCKDDVCGVDP